MKQHALVLQDRSKGLQITPTIAILIATCLLPLMVHLIPIGGGAPAGAMLLPIFYLPFIALIFFKKHVALVAALLAPFINFLLTGNPQWELVTLLSVELVAFVILSAGLLRQHRLKWIAAPVGYLGAKLVSSLVLILLPLLPNLQASDFLAQSIATALPGILILMVINILVLKLKK
ncbi:MAG: hypothetical protein HKN87_10330 [Saprospiraceae bacterium]|nr:hypothetical protein [Saprospiraceae bacterium]